MQCGASFLLSTQQPCPRATCGCTLISHCRAAGLWLCQTAGLLQTSLFQSGHRRIPSKRSPQTKLALPHPSKTCRTSNQLEFRPSRFANATQGTRRVEVAAGRRTRSCTPQQAVQPWPGKMSLVGRGMEHARALVF